jgi:predicted phosphate transport protein (TIGR00153 family)
MSNWLNNYISSSSTFYNLFCEGSRNLAEMCDLLLNGLNNRSLEQREALFKQIDGLEGKGDDITHQIYLALEKVYFTPFKRKDIHVLASAMDDVADHIQETTGRIQLYNIELITPAIKEMSVYISKAISEIEKLTLALHDINNIEEMYIGCKQIKYYEHQTDLIYYTALAELFANEKDPINILKYRDILYSLETAANKCKKTADAIETILINSI